MMEHRSWLHILGSLHRKTAGMLLFLFHKDIAESSLDLSSCHQAVGHIQNKEKRNTIWIT